MIGIGITRATAVPPILPIDPFSGDTWITVLWPGLATTVKVLRSPSETAAPPPSAIIIVRPITALPLFEYSQMLAPVLFCNTIWYANPGVSSVHTLLLASVLTRLVTPSRFSHSTANGINSSIPGVVI